MSEPIQIERWTRPWLPSAGSELVETLNYHDMPLLGVFRHGGGLFLFSCVAGQVEETHAWAYVRLTDSDLRDLDGAAEPEPVRDLTNWWLERGPLTLALARDDAGILSSTQIDRLDPANLNSGLRTLVAEARSYLNRTDAELAETLAILP